MTFRQYLLLMTLASASAWLGWGFIIWSVDPYEAGWLGLALFYATLFVAMVGSWSVVGVIYRVWWMKRRDVMIREVRISFRHGCLFSSVTLIGLMLAAKNLFVWWRILLLFLIVAAIEYLFLLMQEGTRA